MELDSLSLNDLRELAKAKGLSNISKLKKNELIEKILEISQEVSEKKLENTKGCSILEWCADPYILNVNGPII